MASIALVLACAAPATALGQEPPLPGASRGTAPHVPGAVVLRITLGPGDELVAGTCGLTGAERVGDTTLSLHGPGGAQVAFNDDACMSLGSRVRYVVPQGAGGSYELVAGCYEGTCGGTVAWKTRRAAAVAVVPQPSPTALAPVRRVSGRVPHTVGVALRVVLEEGERFEAGTCGLSGATYGGDTTLALRDPSGDVVASNDDACQSLGSHLRFTAVEAGVHEVVGGCYGGAACRGEIAYRVHDPLPPPPPFRIATVARAMVDAEGRGAGLVADGLVEVRWLDDVMVLRLAGGPLGLAGGTHGGFVTGTLYLSLIVDLDVVAVGLGGGVSTSAMRIFEGDQRETAALSAHARIGRLQYFHVEGRLATAWAQDEAVFMSAELLARLPLPGFDLTLRGAGGLDGTALGEAVVTVWLASARSTPIFGLSVHAGGSGVFYEPLCRFGAPCGARWYAGPHVGLGMEWRP